MVMSLGDGTPCPGQLCVGALASGMCDSHMKYFDLARALPVSLIVVGVGLMNQGWRADNIIAGFIVGLFLFTVIGFGSAYVQYRRRRRARRESPGDFG